MGTLSLLINHHSISIYIYVREVLNAFYLSVFR